MKSLLFKYAGLLLIGLFLEWWLLFYSGLNIPTHIPDTPINIGGMAILILWILILTLFIKKCLIFNKSLTIWELTYLGLIVCGFAELIFQIFRHITETFDSSSERLYDIFLNLFGELVMALVISFFISFYAKTKNKSVLLIFIVVFIIAFASIIFFIKRSISAV